MALWMDLADWRAKRSLSQTKRTSPTCLEEAARAMRRMSQNAWTSRRDPREQPPQVWVCSHLPGSRSRVVEHMHDSPDRVPNALPHVVRGFVYFLLQRAHVGILHLLPALFQAAQFCSNLWPRMLRRFLIQQAYGRKA